GGTSSTVTTSNTPTGDPGIALALAGMTVAGAVVLVSRKKD
ncbi:MAG: NPXTG-anchored protein, partial [Oscillospiraceae bacterium]|nr:NPXTG-anchored protein [Oscillospiraceae bacterium]